MLAMYIYHFLYVMKTRARQTRSFTLSRIDIYMPAMFNSYNCLLFLLLQRKGDVIIRHIAALHISGPRESRRDMLCSVGTS